MEVWGYSVTSTNFCNRAKIFPHIILHTEVQETILFNRFLYLPTNLKSISKYVTWTARMSESWVVLMHSIFPLMR